ncbi:MAG TPA: NUDIX hydrolase [Candidatus Poseidoniales archaeon]|nr:MAG TPA: NUDIX hydrolase [Candidatus Poseidoniales archaeon]
MNPDFCLAIITREIDHAILLVRHPERGWELPGGHLEQGETPMQCLEREVKEETGLSLSVMSWNKKYYDRGYVGWMQVPSVITEFNFDDPNVIDVSWWKDNPVMNYWNPQELTDLRRWVLDLKKAQEF